MKLRDDLAEMTKEQIVSLARNYGFKGYSKLRKNELIDGLVDFLSDEVELRRRLVCLTKEQLDLYRKAVISPVETTLDNTIHTLQLAQYWIGSFEEPTDNFCVYEELTAAIQMLESKEFKEENVKKDWLMKCIKFFREYYGIAPIEIIHELYRQRVQCTIDEMIDLLRDVPVLMTESTVIPMDDPYLENIVEIVQLYSEHALMIHIPLLEDNTGGNLLGEQMDKEFFIPSPKIIEEISQKGYEQSIPAYKKLKSFFKNRMGMSEQDAKVWTIQAWANGYEDNLPAVLIQNLLSTGIEVESERVLEDFLELLADAHNNTRIIENRGHKPMELYRMSSKKNEPQRGEKNHQFDNIIPLASYQNRQSMNKDKKISRNAPCPCGSGKKYKKCCGKNE